MVDDGRPDAGLRREQAMALRARIEATRVPFVGDETTTPAELREVLSAWHGRLAGRGANDPASSVPAPADLVTVDDVAALWH
jgi:hypothetical protein